MAPSIPGYVRGLPGVGVSGSVQPSVELSSFEFNSEDLPSADQFPRTRELMNQMPAPVEVSTEHPAGFRLRQRSLQLDSLRVWAMDNQPMVARRNARLIRSSDPETFNLCLLRHGAISATSDRQLARCGPHDLYVNDSSRPFELRMDSPGDPHALIRSVGVQFPKQLLPLPPSQTDRLSGRLVPASGGVGALLTRFLVDLIANRHSYLPSDGMRLGTVLTDLVSALFAHRLELEGALTPETRQRNLVLRIRAFIRQHLHEPGLDPGAIAAAHYISLSYLHRLFRDEGTSVAAWIRQQRLEGARRDLADRALATIPVHRTAARWGFRHPAAFSRLFRTTYGVTPRDYRHQALEPADQPGS